MFKTKSFLQAILVVLVNFLVTSVEAQSLKDLGRDLLGSIAGQVVSAGADKQVGTDLNQLVRELGIEAGYSDTRRFEIPAGAVVGIEIRSNRTNYRDEEVAAAIRAEVGNWGRNLLLGPSFEDRERLARDNDRDRQNVELRNATAPGQAERPAYDLLVTVRQADGYEELGGDVWAIAQRLFRGGAGLEVRRETEFCEITIEVVDARTRLTPANGGIMTSVGVRVVSQLVRGSVGGISFDNDRRNDSASDLRDALKRITKVWVQKNRY